MAAGRTRDLYGVLKVEEDLARRNGAPLPPPAARTMEEQVIRRGVLFTAPLRSGVCACVCLHCMCAQCDNASAH